MDNLREPKGDWECMTETGKVIFWSDGEDEEDKCDVMVAEGEEEAWGRGMIILTEVWTGDGDIQFCSFCSSEVGEGFLSLLSIGNVQTKKKK
jgi:hypothetical protein